MGYLRLKVLNFSSITTVPTALSGIQTSVYLT